MPNAQMEVKQITPVRQAYFEFVAGVAVGVVELLCLYPLDVVKSRLQVQGSFRVPSRDSYSGPINAVAMIYRNEGLSAFYKGFVPQVFVDTPKKGVKFLLYDEIKPLVEHGKDATPMTYAISGAVTGTLEALFLNPFEVIKVVQQVHQEKHLKTLEMARYIIKRNGYGTKGLYRGITALMARNSVFNFTYFGAFYEIKNWLPAAQRPGPELLRKMAIAGFSGALGCSLSVIFDVAKCRIQAPQPVRGVIKYQWTIQTLTTIYCEEGYRALYKGLTPMLMRAVPGAAMLMVLHEAFCDFLVRRYESK